MSQATVNGQWGKIYSHDDAAYLPLRIDAGLNRSAQSE